MPSVAVASVAVASVAVLCGDAEAEYAALPPASVGVAVGAAMSIQRRGEDAKVYCFMGDMTAETGIAHEASKYSRNHRLPIHFIVEDNAKSVCTDTREAWNQPRLSFEDAADEYISYYRYETKYPHAGAGVRVQF